MWQWERELSDVQRGFPGQGEIDGQVQQGTVYEGVFLMNLAFGILGVIKRARRISQSEINWTKRTQMSRGARVLRCKNTQFVFKSLFSFSPCFLLGIALLIRERKRLILYIMY